ncbi:MAG: fused MFS/spermidine synthase [Deltaproteobacteria bacterium]|nr:fused MFS/spermidine synthase [Deltaproteobacteria bacterium]
MILLTCFVLSGASGLILEIVWVRQLTHVFGSTTLAISTVLATFMGGLALGSFLGGRLADRLRIDPLLAYAACELGIAGLALLIPIAIEGYPAANTWAWRHLADSPWALAMARFVLSAALLMPPTTLMGATMPILARKVVTTRDELGELGKRVAILYAANTAGAVLGALSAGFWLVPRFGVRQSGLVAVVLDVVLAIVMGAASRWKLGPAFSPKALPDTLPASALGALPYEDGELTPVDPGTARWALFAFAMSGSVAMTLEVLWSRALSLVIGSSVYSFTLVLAVFLLGLALGAAWIGRPASKAKEPLLALSLVLASVACGVVLAHLVMDDLPRVFLALLEGTKLEVGTIIGIQALIAGIAIFPAAAGLGAVMPLAIRSSAGSMDAVGRDVGRAYAANTAGAILGSFAGGFVVLPLAGLENGVRGCAIIDAVLAGLLAWRSGRHHARRAVLAWGVSVMVLALALISPAWDVALLTSGVFRITVAKRFVTEGEVYRPEVLYYRDGATTTVTVERHGDRLALKNNGKVEASSKADMPTQILVGLAPVLLHGGKNLKVAVIGYGSGVTVGAVAEAPHVARVDVIEIESAVYDAADKYFGPYNHAPERNPKVRRHVGDGRNFLTARDEKYDVIISEPSNPWIAGVASLFSREFYAFAKEHLAEGGMYCQWAQLYELSPRNVKTIYKTFHEAFPHVLAFSAADLSADTFLIGSLVPRPLDLARLEDTARDPKVLAELLRGNVRSAHDLIAMLILGPQEIASFSAGAPIHTDDNARLEFSAPLDLLEAGRTARFADAIYGDLWPYGHLEGLLSGLGQGTERARRETALARALIRHGKRREAAAWIHRARLDGDEAGTARAEELLDRARMKDIGDPEHPLASPEAPLLAALPEAFSPGQDDGRGDAREHAARQVSAALSQVQARRWEEAHRILKGLPLPADGDPGRDLRLLFGFVLYKTLRLEEAEAMLGPLLEHEAYLARRPVIRYYLGRVRYGLGMFAEGADLLEVFVEGPRRMPPTSRHPGDSEAQAPRSDPQSRRSTPAPPE